MSCPGNLNSKEAVKTWIKNLDEKDVAITDAIATIRRLKGELECKESVTAEEYTEYKAKIEELCKQ